MDLEAVTVTVDPHNLQYAEGSAPFGMGGIASTGAPGTESTGAAGSAPHLADVAVSIPGASSQAPIPTASVNVGDTFSSSSDSPVPAGGDPLTGLTGASLLSTGSGHGSAGHNQHPDARPGSGAGAP